MGLAVLPLVWIALQPVLPQLHHVLSSHRHHYCVEHGRFEDILPDAVGSTAEPTPGHRLGWSRTAKPHADPVCLLSNWVPQPSLSSGLGWWTTHAPDPDRTTGRAAADAHGPSPLTRAPKQSPPA